MGHTLSLYKSIALNLVLEIFPLGWNFILYNCNSVIKSFETQGKYNLIDNMKYLITLHKMMKISHLIFNKTFIFYFNIVEENKRPLGWSNILIASDADLRLKLGDHFLIFLFLPLSVATCITVLNINIY